MQEKPASGNKDLKGTLPTFMLESLVVINDFGS